MWHKGFLHKLSSYGISWTVFSFIKSLLSGRTMKVIINGCSSEEHEINAGISQGTLLSPTLFLLYINNLPTNILRSLINIMQTISWFRVGHLQKSRWPKPGSWYLCKPKAHMSSISVKLDQFWTYFKYCHLVLILRNIKKSLLTFKHVKFFDSCFC